jgi:hypothetical protein
LADYLITWVDYAFDQYLALEQQISTELNDQLRQLAHDPTRRARYEPGTDRWSIDVDAGRGLLVYIVNEENRRVVILRLLHAG